MMMSLPGVLFIITLIISFFAIMVMMTVIIFAGTVMLPPAGQCS
jgi:hypothetical protein